jgi:hypothetical protein
VAFAVAMKCDQCETLLKWRLISRWKYFRLWPNLAMRSGSIGPQMHRVSARGRVAAAS